MQFSEAWLRELVNPALDTQALVEQITMAGLEVDSVNPAAAEFSGVVVGQVVSVVAHPDADKLRVCKVEVGESEPLQIVCGASNVREGLKIPAALIGAVLPGDFQIKKSKLRGELSFGMLCSEKELGMAADADGLMELAADAPVGTDIREYLALDDQLIEVDLTPNRADCLSVEGVAREVALLNNIEFEVSAVSSVAVEHQETLDVKVSAQEACPRYLGRLIKGVNATAETPLWMQERLRRSGLRSLGPVVDVTNYVLLEMGQPLHAFDAAKLSGGIEVRMANADEVLGLLNDQEIKANTETLVIADAEKALALAGVMGGSESAVSDSTKDIFLECAFFNPSFMMGKARHFGLHTDSSHRFERGVDANMQTRAIERATQLIVEIAGGSVGAITEAVAEQYLPQRPAVTLRQLRIKRILGVALAEAEVEGILQRLGMAVVKDSEGWQVTPPGFRFDIAIEADLIEELGRVYGYNNLPQSSLLMRSALSQAPEAILEIDQIKDLLVGRDYQEAITYSFVDEELQKALVPDDTYIKLQNPISSELAVMRTTLWCGLLQAAAYNTKRQQSRVRFFEAGQRFLGTDVAQQEKMLAGIALGSANAEQWAEKASKVDFYDVKADVEAICALTGGEVQFLAAKHSALHPGQSAEIQTMQGESLGWIGMLHPTLEKQLGFDTNVFLFELSQAVLLERKVPSFNSLSKFPSVRRDLALLLEEQVSFHAVEKCINDCQEKLIKEVMVFDIYRGQGVEQGYKSIALALIMQDATQTLTDAEIDAIVNRVLDALSNKLSAKLRD
ncbi:phenylalanyl-tRNA synthetase beta chain [Bathymodiolus platifrons methanotrophic gill symbiont]|uniref:phenylalanine--tRNA ligase subunit beta n=1 Tax=Bathymodiolus platifrons methanotrophic gill symbiont TaxID=113268 RepID=UPI000B41D2E9|nr:phenylalanine--tRNA ligase subunit beta [Bathymodiolus platifrons methanotrophic gill symbiont]MCK5869495.1 phenylalanine--tRNA ligase subunit beta [Methyloprofundus sp.]TXK96974.1 phenylalanine--tRNA ligase subunit beta [Methylococcaceae bacterium CS4]TXK98341.1 phenylalanine--tRNA ligase subunit beta [Methylococcaceae bacterium CS5]TXL04495.1 phenylalanine--tRNA ligase subunit beta [Methylococcaceae bacterium CS3]TXL05982.1 phenylalanine--tRNA ligase subunit beta [Methylococcaceae bacteri